MAAREIHAQKARRFESCWRRVFLSDYATKLCDFFVDKQCQLTLKKLDKQGTHRIVIITSGVAACVMVWRGFDVA